MRNILARSQREVLEEITCSKMLLGFDFDGTLAPIVADPDRAGLRARTRQRLITVARLYPVVVISGRARADVRKRLGGVRVKGVVGNHGLEPWGEAQRYARLVQRWLSRVEKELAGLQGVVIEDKGYSLSVHYRQSRKKRETQAKIMDIASRLKGVRVVGGKLVVNVMPEGAPHKGIALERERDRLHLDTAIYIGDDDTDEDVFALDRPGRLLSIRVGKKAKSFAPYCIEDQGSIDELLKVLIELRRKQRPQSRAAE